MEQYAGRLLADRYRLPRPPADAYELVETRAYDTASGQEVLVRQVPLPEVLDAEVLDGGHPRGPGPQQNPRDSGLATRTPDDPVVRRALEAAAAAASLPDHARLDQIFDVFVQGDGLWIVSELVPGRPLAALLAEHRMGPYRAAEIAADVLAALRVVHAHGWTHRNITARTVLVCDDGRAMLTGLAAGAAEEVLCGYDPFPVDQGADSGTTLTRGASDDSDAGGPPPVPGARDAGPRPPAEEHAAPPPYPSVLDGSGSAGRRRGRAAAHRVRGWWWGRG
ncbi:protein kinase, partial [Streptomyces spiramenti]|nr:protein kinase [Streptomyces spiramenti]